MNLNLMKEDGTQRVVLVGGNGALGRTTIDELKSQSKIIHSIDLHPNPQATHNHLLDKSQLSDPSYLQAFVEEFLAQGHQYDAILCVAGGWEGGSVDSPNFISSVMKMWEMNVVSAVLATALTPKLKKDGLVVFTSAKATLDGTPGMMGYGMAKAAINHLAKSLAMDKHMKEATVVVILPETLDTEANRKAMPKADFSNWTPLPEIASHFASWIEDKGSRPCSSTFCIITTRQGSTKYDITDW